MSADLSRHTWVFAHGSLMFSAGFEPAVVLPARVWGWERRFGQPSVRNWGQVGYPSPTCSLTRGEGCDGLVLALPHSDAASVYRTILEREATPPITVKAETEHGALSADAWPMGSAWNDLGPDELADAAVVNISSGGGPSGNAWEYVSGVARALADHGLNDVLVSEYHAVLRSRLVAK